MIWLWKNMEFNFCIFFLIWYWFLSVSVALIWTGFASLLLYLIWPNIIGQVKWIWPLLNFGWLNELAQPVVWVGQINRLMVLSQSTGHKVDSPLLINQADLLQIYLVCVEWPVCYEFREHGANEAEHEKVYLSTGWLGCLSQPAFFDRSIWHVRSVMRQPGSISLSLYSLSAMWVRYVGAFF